MLSGRFLSPTLWVASTAIALSCHGERTDKGGAPDPAPAASDSGSPDAEPPPDTSPADTDVPLDSGPQADSAPVEDSASVDTSPPDEPELDTGLSGGLDTATAPPPCLTDLGPASPFDVFTFGDYRGGVDVGGAVATGDDLALEGFILGALSAGGPTAVVGGDLSLTTGTVYGDLEVGGLAAVAADVTLAGGSLGTAVSVDFVLAKAQLQRLSAGLAAESPTATASLAAWGELQVVGSDSSLNIIAADGADLVGASGLMVSAPAGSTVVVNLTRASVIENLSPVFVGVDPAQVLFNLPDATALSLTNLGWQSAVLAPRAAVTFTNGAYAGTLVARSLSGDGHFTPAAFTGSLPCH